MADSKNIWWEWVYGNGFDRDGYAKYNFYKDVRSIFDKLARFDWFLDLQKIHGPCPFKGGKISLIFIYEFSTLTKWEGVPKCIDCYKNMYYKTRSRRPIRCIANSSVDYHFNKPITRYYNGINFSGALLISSLLYKIY